MTGVRSAEERRERRPQELETINDLRRNSGIKLGHQPLVNPVTGKQPYPRASAFICG
jgi:hypothetical protein